MIFYLTHLAETKIIIDFQKKNKMLTFDAYFHRENFKA